MNRIITSLLIAAGLMASAALSPVAAQQRSDNKERIELAQACGWYAITSCTRSYRDARRFARRFRSGRVIDTSSPQFPNFSPGFYCVADGPTSRRVARGLASDWRRAGLAPDAYAKSAC